MAWGMNLLRLMAFRFRVKPVDKRETLHVPSVFYNRGAQGPSFYNYGRLEHDILHNVSAAVQALFTYDMNHELARMHINAARKLLDRLEEDHVNHIARVFGGPK